MQFDAKSGIFSVDTREASRMFRTRAPASFRPLPPAGEVSFSSLSADGSFVWTGYADAAACGILRFSRDCAGVIDASDRRLASIEGALLSTLARDAGAFRADATPLLHVTLHSPFGDEEWEEECPLKEAQKLREKVERDLTDTLAYARERIKVRRSSMKDVPFPFGEVRLSQRDMIDAVDEAIASRRPVFLCAPTGTGKTMGALFPAVRSVGRGRGEKIFYFTSRGTGALPAADAVRALAGAGAQLRAVSLSAKEKLCTRARDCSGGVFRCPSLADADGERMRAAVADLMQENALPVSEAALVAAASAHHVCPYELSLEYSRHADVIICDCNYLFDPYVYLRRYFAGDGGDYIFLIDESHNLPARAREMYSARITSRDVCDAIALFGALDGDADGVTAARLPEEKFTSALTAALADEEEREGEGGKFRFTHRGDCPADAAAAVRELGDMLACRLAVRRARVDDETASLLRRVRDARKLFSRFTDTFDRFDRHYECFLWQTPEGFDLRLYCLDPSERLAERLARGRVGVFFSATLSPVDYYRSLLNGGEGNMLALDSPFDRENLCVAVMDKIAVTTSAREGTLADVLRVIDVTVRAKCGNYIVFCPSFAYMETLAARYREAHPEADVAVQARQMNAEARRTFLARFRENPARPFVAFCVLGGIYAEGIDLAGDRLIGAIVIGVGMPTLSVEREAIAAYYDRISDCGREFAYIYPGMNRVLQAAGRVIRSENDRGVLVLIDERFADYEYRKILPPEWHHLRYAATTDALARHIRKHWENN